MFENLNADTGITWTSYDDMVNEMANFDGYDFLSYHASIGSQVTQHDDYPPGEGTDTGDDIVLDLHYNAVDPRLCSLQTPSVASGTSFTPSRLFSRRSSSPESSDSRDADPEGESSSDGVASHPDAPNGYGSPATTHSLETSFGKYGSGSLLRSRQLSLVAVSYAANRPLRT